MSVVGLRAVGRLVGGDHAQEQGRLANENPPKLRTHDRYGHRVDEVEFHPAWHDLMNSAITHGLHAAPWRDQRPGAHLDRAARFYVWGHAEAGHLCPVSMTYAIVPALRHAPDLARQYEPLLASTAYDPSRRPGGRQAGADGRHVDDGEAGRLGRARQHHDGDEDRRRQLPHHRPQVVHVRSDGRPLHGPGADRRPELLPAPQVLPDGSRNAMYLQRSRTSATARTPRPRSSTTTRRPGSWARRAAASAPSSTCQRDPAGLRAGRRHRPAPRRHPRGASRALPQGVRQEAHRPAPDDERPFAALAIEFPRPPPRSRCAWPRRRTARPAATRASVQLPAARPGRDPSTHLSKLSRLRMPPRRSSAWAATATSRNPALPRLYREAPLQSIWEGSGDVAALEHAARPDPPARVRRGVLRRARAGRGADGRLDDAVEKLKKDAADPRASRPPPGRVDGGHPPTSLLVRHGHPAVADAFAATRLSGEGAALQRPPSSHPHRDDPADPEAGWRGRSGWRGGWKARLRGDHLLPGRRRYAVAVAVAGAEVWAPRGPRVGGLGGRRIAGGSKDEDVDAWAPPMDKPAVR